MPKPDPKSKPKPKPKKKGGPSSPKSPKGSSTDNGSEVNSLLRPALEDRMDADVWAMVLEKLTSRFDLTSCMLVSHKFLRAALKPKLWKRVRLQPDVRFPDSAVEGLVDRCRTTLESLSLRGCRGLSNSSIRFLLISKTLAHLDLSHCSQIGDAGLETVASIHQLKSLFLERCLGITDRGLKHIGTLKDLQSVNLHGCSQITSKGIDSLGTCRSLVRLDVYGCGTLEPEVMDRLFMLPALQYLNDKYRYPMHAIVQGNKTEELAFMITHHFDVNCKDDYDKTPLHVASSTGNHAGMNLLLQANAKTAEYDMEGCFPLHYAALNGHVALLEKLRQLTGTEARTKDGRTPLVCALERGQVDFAKELIEAGADPNSASLNGITSLHACARLGNTELASVLLKYGARVTLSDEGGALPIHYAAQFGHTEFLRILVKAGSELDPRAIKGWAPLHYAAANCSLLAFRVLVELGADRTLLDNFGRTADEVLKVSYGIEDVDSIDLVEDEAPVYIENSDAIMDQKSVLSIGSLSLQRKKSLPDIIERSNHLGRARKPSIIHGN